MSYFWIVADTEEGRRALMGPYIMHSKAIMIKDKLDDPNAEIYETSSGRRSEAVQEIREPRVRKIGLDEGFKNFNHEAGKECS